MINGIGIIVPIDGTADWRGAALWVGSIGVGLAFIFTLVPVVAFALPRTYYWWLDRVLLRDVDWQKVERFRKRRLLRLFGFAVFVCLAIFEASLWLSIINTFVEHGLSS